MLAVDLKQEFREIDLQIELMRVADRLKVEICVPDKLSANIKFKKLWKASFFVKFATNSFGCRTLLEL